MDVGRATRAPERRASHAPRHVDTTNVEPPTKIYQIEKYVGQPYWSSLHDQVGIERDAVDERSAFTGW